MSILIPSFTSKFYYKELMSVNNGLGLKKTESVSLDSKENKRMVN